MVEGIDQNPHLSRRTFIKLAGEKVLQATAAVAASKFLGASHAQPSPEPESGTIGHEEEVFTHKIVDEDLSFELSFTALPIKPKSPYISNDGKYYDLAKKQYVNSDQCTPEMLLLGDGPAFIEGRDVMITPEFVNNEVTEKIIATGYENINKYVSQNNRSTSETIEVGGVVIESTITNNETTFTPSTLLKLRQFQKAIADTLNYDREAPNKFKKLSLSARLKAGYTNCQEFSLTTSTILAGEPLYMPSEILRFGYEIPDEEANSDDDSNIKKAKAHVCNVINFNNTPVIIDSTFFGNGPMTLSEYFKEYSRNGIKITTPIKFTSILASNSYLAFPWNDSNWVNATTALSIQVAGESAS